MSSGPWKIFHLTIIIKTFILKLHNTVFKVDRPKDAYVAIKEKDATYSFTRVPPANRVKDTSFKYGGQVRQFYLV